MDRLQDTKVLIYSHDSFGLGHLRRCRTIAHSLVDSYKGINVLIVSGSPVISQFDFKSRVNFITIPGVVKLRDGDYTSLALHVDIDQTLAIRSSMIQHAAEIFDPDVFIVDKEPLGLRGEVEHTLKLLKLRGTINVLGLRDVMDDAEALQTEWQRKNVAPALEDLYDEIWVYGSESIANPIQGIEITGKTREKMHYLGYLRRELPPNQYLPNGLGKSPYILITTGGGGDGEMLVDWVIRAYESAYVDQLLPGYIVFGPFMSQTTQRKFQARIRKIPKLESDNFYNHIELMMAVAAIA